MSEVAKVKFTDYPASVASAMDLVGSAKLLAGRELVIIKPNLTNSSPPPVTTPVAAAEAVYDYCRAHCDGEIVIAEGAGTGNTPDVFRATGYAELADRRGIRLIDFDAEPSIELSRDDALQLKRLHLPEIALDAFIISLPILKDHSFTGTTVAMKNMFGLAPKRYYSGSWNKSKLHSPSTDRSVYDVCLYRSPDLCVVDAVVALTGMHLAGDPKEIGLILAGADPVAVDAVASQLLGHDPADLEYLALANGVLGDMDNIQLLEG